MTEPHHLFRLVQHFDRAKLERFKAMSVSAKLQWLEKANKQMYDAFKAAGHTEPYDPQSWPYITK